MSTLSIGKWNYKRNKLIFDQELEINMLAEEESEFKDGLRLYYEVTDCDNLLKDDIVIDSVVEMIDAYCDYMYVYTGTSIKSIGTGMTLDYGHKQSLMHSVLTEILLTHGTKLFHKKGLELPFMEQCFQFVIEANERKPIVKTIGKVTKGNKFRDPKEDIRELLLSSGFLADANEAFKQYQLEVDKKLDMKPVNITDLPETPEGA